MNKDIKTKWLEALRSGRYYQGQKRLLYSGKHCCLGVLCDIMGCTWEPMPGGAYEARDGIDASTVELPRATLRKAELTHTQQSILANRNDLDGWSFDRIADWIEENL